MYISLASAAAAPPGAPPSRASPAHPSSKKAKGTPNCAQGCTNCEAWQLLCESLSEKLAKNEAALAAKEEELDAREIEFSVRAEALAKSEEQLRLANTKLKEEKAELDKRIAQVERESERVTPPSVVRQQSKRAKIEERMQLAVTLNKLPRDATAGDVDTVKAALSRMGKSYQDFNEGAHTADGHWNLIVISTEHSRVHSYDSLAKVR